MFKYVDQFMTAEENDLDALIDDGGGADEAHRIRQTSVDRYTKAALRTDRLQVDELIATTRVPVFLLDEHQMVRPGEMGSLEQLTRYAQHVGIDVEHGHLGEQFRCGGSEAYPCCRRSACSASPTTRRPRGPRGPQFSVTVADSPEELENLLRTKLDEGCSARMSTGYCWPWSDPQPDGTLVPDVQVGGWARPWNLKGDRRIGDATPSVLWATDDGASARRAAITPRRASSTTGAV